MNLRSASGRLSFCAELVTTIVELDAALLLLAAEAGGVLATTTLELDVALLTPVCVAIDDVTFRATPTVMELPADAKHMFLSLVIATM